MMAPDGARASVEDHTKILKSIKDRNTEALAAIMEAHIERAAERYKASPAVALL